METKGGEKSFEKLLKVLLRRSYQPVEARPEFRSDLLAKLKGRQAGIAQAAALRRRKIIYLASGAASLAASVAIAFTLLVATQPDKSSRSHLVALEAPSPTNTIKVDPIPRDAATANSESNWSSRTRGMLEVADEGGWHDAGQSVKLASDTTLRIKAGKQGGLEIAPGSWLVLDGGEGECLVRLVNGAVAVEHGRICVQNDGEAKPVKLKLASNDVEVSGGSILALDLKNASLYASGGSPAPTVALVSGHADLSRDGARASLAEGMEYQLHTYAAPGKLPGKRIDEAESRASSSWIKPTLVNFQQLTIDGK